VVEKAVMVYHQTPTSTKVCWLHKNWHDILPIYL